LLGAAEKNRSPLIYPFIRIALLTGMRGGEIRTLQVGRVNLRDKALRVGRAKTPAGEGRGIPMNAELFATISNQVGWLKKTFGEPEPEWYLFPFCNTVRPIDPTRPVTSLKTAWESVRTAAAVNCRLHDLRHTAATKMAENGMPEATMKALLGHMSTSMIERYSHIRDAAKREAVEGLKLATAVFGVPKESPKVEQKRRLKVVSK
jgi:integrase